MTILPLEKFNAKKMELGIMAALLVAAAGIFMYSWKKKQADERAEDLQKLATDLGLAFSKKDDFGLLDSLKRHELFDRLDLFNVCRIENIAHGSVGLTAVFLFDYSYLVSNGKSARRIFQTCFFAKNASWGLPKFKLRPEGWWQKVKQYFGDRDINFADSPDFSDWFWLKGDFESQIREAFSPAVRAFFEENPPISVDGDNFHLVSWKPKRLLQPADARAFFEKNLKLIELLQSDRKDEFLKLADLEKPLAEAENPVPDSIREVAVKTDFSNQKR